MAELFKKNKAEIETYFAKQDLAGIVSELCLENLISNAEKYEINSTEPSKRAHTLTKILESKIVNNPDLFQNLKQFLGSFEDFSEREILTTVETASASDGELGINQDESTGKFVNESSQSETIGPVAAPMVQRWSDVVRCSRPASYSKSAREIAKVHFSRQKRPLERNAGKQVPYLRSTSLSHTSVGLHSVEPRQQRTRHQKAHTLAGYAYPTDTRRPRKKRSDTLSFGATEKYTTVSKTKSPAAKISKTKNQPSQHSEVYPGIDFSSHRSRAMVGHKGSTIRGEGVQLRIPPNAIKRGTSLDISLHGCISGPFSLPENTQLASPVFLVTCTPPYQFQREVTLTMHHFVQLQNREQCRDMVLLSSPQMKMEDEDFAYWKFSFCDQRLQCFPHTSYGEVELTHFSFLCFGIRLSRGRSMDYVLDYTELFIVVLDSSSGIEVPSECTFATTFYFTLI